MSMSSICEVAGHHESAGTPPGSDLSFALVGLGRFSLPAHDGRRGLHSCAASRLALDVWRRTRQSLLPIFRSLLPVFLLLLCLAVLAAPSPAQSWRIADFQDVISISSDGSTLVKERISLVFIGQWHGIHRTIPIDYPGPQGTNYTLFLDIKSVTDGAGQKLKYESTTSGGYRNLKIYIPDAVDASRTVEIDYVVRNGIRYFEGHDEFYWNITGNDWPVPIDHVAA